MTPTRSAVSIIVPVFNEESQIEGLLDNLDTLRAGELIIADGQSEDRTVDLARLRAILIEAPRGRARQMNAGARAARGDVLLFLHADTRLRPGALDAIAEALADPAVAGGNFDILYEGGDRAAAAFSAINRWRRRFRIFYGDSGIFCRRHVFEQLGGYQDWPILEDYDFARRLSRAGRLALLDEPIYVSDRRWRRDGVLRTLWSWFWVQALYLAGLSPHKLASLYRNTR